MESIEKSIARYFEHFENAFSLYENLESIGRFSAIGMGGSGIAGMFIENNYGGNSINSFYDENLEKKLEKERVLVSYSGNTKETLSWTVLSNFIGVTSGGKLKKICEERKLRCVELPKGLAPRASFPYMLSALSILNSKLAFVEVKEMWEKAKENKIKIEEMAKEVAESIEGELIVYGEERTKPQAYRLKTQLNENAKERCSFGLIPEILHNEIEGLGSFKGTIITFVYSKFSLKVSKVLKRKGFKVISYESRGNYVEDVYFADVLSLEYAKRKGLRGKEIDEVNNIKAFKEELNE